jgi:hypothetical protein
MRSGRIARKKRSERPHRTKPIWSREIGQLHRAIVGRETTEETSNESGEGVWDAAIVTAIRAMARLRRHEGDMIDRLFDDMTTNELDE